MGNLVTSDILDQFITEEMCDKAVDEFPRNLR